MKHSLGSSTFIVVIGVRPGQTAAHDIKTDRIFHETKFVFLSCAEVARGAVVHTTVDVSLQDAWAKTLN